MARAPAIELVNVTKAFTLDAGKRVTAVDNVSLSLGAGEFVCVVGPSGHGKSTLVNLIAGFMIPTAGEVVCHGKGVSGPGPERGVIFQTDTVFLWRRVRDNVAYGLKSRRVPRAERELKVHRLLQAVGLTEFAHAWPKQLSAGMRRRVAIAAVFANEPEVLLLDEPFSGLDYARRASLHKVLVDLWTAAGNTVLFVTHDIEEALALANRIIVMVRGRIVQDMRVALPRPRDARALQSDEMTRVRVAVIEQLEAAIKPGEEA